MFRVTVFNAEDVWCRDGLVQSNCEGSGVKRFRIMTTEVVKIHSYERNVYSINKFNSINSSFSQLFNISLFLKLHLHFLLFSFLSVSGKPESQNQQCIFNKTQQEKIRRQDYFEHCVSRLPLFPCFSLTCV